MNVKQLKNSILQWAIQRTFVPQDPNDEPASVLMGHESIETTRIYLRRSSLEQQEIVDKVITW